MSILIVSDYDGTLKQDEHIESMKSNVDLLKRISHNKAIFMLSTGRLFRSMKSEIEKFDIPFQYLSCANGNILFDKNFQVLFKTYINSEILNNLKPFYRKILSIDALDEYGTLVANNPTEYLLHLVEEPETRRKVVNMLLDSPIVDYCTDGSNKYTIHVFSMSSKITTIEIVKKMLNISNEAIYTIGDGPNDLEMIKRYNGFIIGNAVDNGTDSSYLPKFNTFSDCVEEIQHILRRRR